VGVKIDISEIVADFKGIELRELADYFELDDDGICEADLEDYR